MPRIFISYRRNDSEGYVGRLYDQLIKSFDKKEVFLDVGTIKPGEDFVVAIEKAVGTCNVLIAVIGPRWLNMEDSKGKRLLDNPNDFVRLEIVTALRRSIPVIPVLVGRSKVPSHSDLPDDLSALVKHNALELSHHRFSYDVDRLVETIGGAYGVVRISAYPSLLSKIDMGLIGDPFELYIDHPVHDRKAPHVRFKGSEGVTLRIEKGVHTIHIRHRAFDSSPLHQSSNELSFSLKGGQTVLFSFGLESPEVPFSQRRFGWASPPKVPFSQLRLVIRPYKWATALR